MVELHYTISFFKNKTIKSNALPDEAIFTSSGTTGMHTSKHHVPDLGFYETNFLRSFELFYGDIRDYTVLALLPGYLERKGSSLIYMTNKLIAESQQPKSGFYLYDHHKLVQVIQDLEQRQQKVLLLGVTHALLDLADAYKMQLQHTTIMETGGMKGKRKELTRQELHQYLTARLGVSAIHSEYGMTELLSQAYSHGEGLFRCPPWMQIRIRDPYDPLSAMPDGASGGINVIDLGNIDSCAFIETADLGKKHLDGSFEILGRFDNSDIRGCNLLVQ